MSSEQSSLEMSTGKLKKTRKIMVPVVDSVLKVKSKTKQIIINISMTRYEVIADVAEDLEWRIQTNAKKGDWDVLWVDQMIEPETLIKMHFFQKISHFPGIHVLARKNLLGMTFMEMNAKFPEAYNFFPTTYLLPADYPNFRQEVEKGQNKCFIVKPEADCQGRGIFLTFRTEEVENGKHYVVQDYLHDPFLVDGLKFDFRVYVLLCGTNPMRLYVYEEGLARLATEQYSPPNKLNIKKMFMHLTNYAVNKKNPKYIYNKSSKNMGIGHKRSLTSILEDIGRRGLNVEVLKSKIDDVLVKTVILGQPLVSHQYKFAQPDDTYRNMCFHILGVDVMIDEKLNPIVLEVNHTPSFATDTPLDYFIKYNLIKDTLILMDVNEESKSRLIKKTNNYQRERVTNAKRLIENEEQKQQIRECQCRRDEYESQNCGRYRKIYPVQSPEQMEEYQQYIQYAEKTYFSDNNCIRSQIETEKLKENNGSKKSLTKKKSIVSSPEKSQRKSQEFSNKKSYNKQEAELIRVRNSSTQLVHTNTHESSLLNSLVEDPSSCFKSNDGRKIDSNYIRIAKSISEQEPTTSNRQGASNRVNLIRNLPKLDRNWPISPCRKPKYVPLRKQRIQMIHKGESKEQRCNKTSKGSILPSGIFVTPKMIKFTSSDEKESKGLFFL